MFEHITRRVSETAKAAARKSGDVLDVAKMNISIGIEEEKIDKALIEIGRLYHAAHQQGTAVADEVREWLDQVDICKNTIEQIQSKILDLRQVKVCEGCKKEVSKEYPFCPFCGFEQPVPPEEPEEEAPVKCFCPECGTETAPDANFCSRCGKNLKM